MAATICIGGFCIPVYALLPFALMILQGFWNWFRKNVLGHDDGKIPENARLFGYMQYCMHSSC
ncbi:Thioredoxin [Phytophthora palmivora]|uniref:Thioredoxin n=1 Tax=Phytophthora palmivora TaxID=4796 RepID=A0A2P4YEN9_9STRA|nr:Thioredoxin [Phytophthora palmivora]